MASTYQVRDRIEEARQQDNMIKQLRAEFGVIDANNDRMITRDELHEFFLNEKVRATTRAVPQSKNLRLTAESQIKQTSIREILLRHTESLALSWNARHEQLLVGIDANLDPVFLTYNSVLLFCSSSKCLTRKTGLKSWMKCLTKSTWTIAARSRCKYTTESSVKSQLN